MLIVAFSSVLHPRGSDKVACLSPTARCRNLKKKKNHACSRSGSAPLAACRSRYRLSQERQPQSARPTFCRLSFSLHPPLLSPSHFCTFSEGAPLRTICLSHRGVLFFYFYFFPFRLVRPSRDVKNGRGSRYQPRLLRARLACGGRGASSRAGPCWFLQTGSDRREGEGNLGRG